MINKLLTTGEDISGPWIALFLGAFAGAVFSYFFSKWQSRQTIRARRDVLIRALHRQLDMIPYSVSKPDLSGIMSWNYVHVTVVDDLLSGETLDAKHDADLIQLLTSWRALERRQSEVLAVARNATLSTDLPNWIRNKIYQEAYDLHLGIREYREQLRRLLPPDNVAYARLSAPKNDYLDWGKPKRKLFALWPKHLLFRLRLRIYQRFDFISRTKKDLDRDSLYRDYIEREKAVVIAKELANREKIRVIFDQQIFPKLEATKQLLNDHRVQFHYGKRVDQDFDSSNPDFSDYEVKSYTSIGMSRRHSSGEDGWYGQYLRAKSTPDGISVDFVGRDRHKSSIYSVRGWCIPVARNFQEFTPERVQAVILQQYIDTLGSRPRRQFLQGFLRNPSGWPRY